MMKELIYRVELYSGRSLLYSEEVKTSEWYVSAILIVAQHYSAIQTGIVPTRIEVRPLEAIFT